MNYNSLTAESVIALKRGVAIRFEHNYKNGVVILIDTINDSFLIANNESKILIQLLNHNKSLQIKNIFAQILTEYNEACHEKVLKILNDMINLLYKKHFIEIII